MADNNEHIWTLPALKVHFDAQLAAQKEAVKSALDALNAGRSQTSATISSIMAGSALLISIGTALLQWAHR